MTRWENTVSSLKCQMHRYCFPKRPHRGREVLLWSSPTLLLPGDFERLSYNKFRMAGFRIRAVAWLCLLHPGYTQDGGTGNLHCCRCCFSVLPTWFCSETHPRGKLWTNPIPTKSPRNGPLTSAEVGYHRWCFLAFWPLPQLPELLKK